MLEIMDGGSLGALPMANYETTPKGNLKPRDEGTRRIIRGLQEQINRFRSWTGYKAIDTDGIVGLGTTRAAAAAAKVLSGRGLGGSAIAAAATRSASEMNYWAIHADELAAEMAFVDGPGQNTAPAPASPSPAAAAAAATAPARKGAPAGGFNWKPWAIGAAALIGGLAILKGFPRRKSSR